MSLPTHSAASVSLSLEWTPKFYNKIEKLADIVSPVILANLMLYTTSQLEKMNASVGYSDDKDVDFGDEFREAEQLDELPE